MLTTLQRVRRSDRTLAIDSRYLGNNPTNATDPTGLFAADLPAVPEGPKGDAKQNARNFFYALDFATLTEYLSDWRNHLYGVHMNSLFLPTSPLPGPLLALSTQSGIMQRIQQIEQTIGVLGSLGPIIIAQTVIIRDNQKDKPGLAMAKELVAGALKNPLIKTRVQMISTLQMNLFKEYFSDGKGGVDFTKVRVAMQQFNNFDLVKEPFKIAAGQAKKNDTAPAEMQKNIPGGPNSVNAHLMWIAFAQLAISAGVDQDFWKQMRPIFLMGTDITQQGVKNMKPLTQDEITKLWDTSYKNAKTDEDIKKLWKAILVKQNP